MSYPVFNPFQVFIDNSGQPLQNGYIYIGAKNLNPESNPVVCYLDSAMTRPIAQPVRTVNGLPAYNGSPVNIYTSGEYSITVRDASSQLVYTSQLGAQFFSGSGNMATVASISDLRSLPKTGVQYVNVAGYYPGAYALSNPSGGGQFTYNATDITYGWYGTGSISGTTLTVASTVNGALAIGQQLNYAGSDGTVYIVSGSGASWTLNKTPGTIATTTMTGDNGGSVIVALDGGRWYRKAESPINAMAFGAKGDAISDDTFAINSAIAFAHASKNCLHLPTGTYKTTSSVAFGYNNATSSGSIGTTYSGLVVFGDGPDRTILLPTVATGSAYQISGNNSDTNSNNIPRGLVLRDLSMNGVGCSSGVHGVEISQIAEVTLENVKASGFAGGDAVHLNRPNHLFNIGIYDCQLVSCGRGVGCSAASYVYLLNMRNCWISAHTIESARIFAYGGQIAGCAFAGSPTGLYISALDNMLAGCTFEGNSTYDLHMVDCQQMKVETPRFISNATNAIPVRMESISGTTRHNSIDASHFVGYDLSGVGKNVFQIADGIGVTIGKYFLESCTMGTNAELSWGAGYLATSFGNNYWDNTVNNWYFIPGELRVNNWVPAFTGLATTGAAPTITGYYTKIGRLVHFKVVISTTGTTASTAGNTWINNLPYTAYASSICSASNSGTIASYGNGVVSGNTTNCYAPTWPALANTIIISGTYEISA